jgi:uncharacterized RDD family membrane protein YckC
MPEELNPYAPPREAVDINPDLDGGELIDASTGQRLVTCIIDYVGVMLFGAMVGVGLALLDATEVLIAMPDFVFGVGLMTLYYVGFESVFGRTPGKMIMGTRVVTDQGGTPSILQILGRTFIRFVPFEPFSAFGGGQMWHDSWSSTRVVSTR